MDFLSSCSAAKAYAVGVTKNLIDCKCTYCSSPQSFSKENGQCNFPMTIIFHGRSDSTREALVNICWYAVTTTVVISGGLLAIEGLHCNAEETQIQIMG